MKRPGVGRDLERTDDDTARLGMEPEGQNLDHIDLV
jgi:hypothetical protein